MCWIDDLDWPDCVARGLAASWQRLVWLPLATLEHLTQFVAHQLTSFSSFLCLSTLSVCFLKSISQLNVVFVIRVSSSGVLKRWTIEWGVEKSS